MDKDDLSLITYEPPPPKKRRLHLSGFESSFHVVNPSPSKPLRRGTATQSRLSTTVHDFTSVFETRTREGRRTPKPPRLAFDENTSEVYTNSNNINSPVHHPHSHRRKRVSATFSEFTSTFEISLPQPTLRPRAEPAPSKVARYPHRILSPDVLRTRTLETGSVISTVIGPQTPTHMLKPPSFRETVESLNHFSSQNHLISLGKVSPSFGITSVADTDKLKLSSMTSHLASLATPKRTDVDRKLLPIPPPISAPESSKVLNEATTTASPTVSHAERAQILANSVRIPLTQQPANVELAELSRGLELSPQKGGRAHGTKLIRGGLAERVEHLLFRSSTNFSLWQAGFAKQLERAKCTKEDIRLRISSILSYTKNTTGISSNGLPRTVITKCTKVLQGAPEGNGNSPQEETVVFLFSNHDRVSSAINFQEGKEVCVWRPWQEVELPEVLDGIPLPALKVGALPTPGEFTTGRRTALLCSRFLILL